MNGLAVMAFVLVSALGLVGLGRLAGAGSVPLAWVVGWTVVWWPVALVAAVAGPSWGARAGLVILAVGTAAWAVRSGSRKVELGAASAAVLAGAPFYLAPPYFYDALVYHLGLPWGWLVNGDFAPAAHNLFSHFPLAGPTVFLTPMTLGLDRAAAGLHWVTFCIVLLAAYRLARRLGAGRSAIAAPLLLASVWHALWVAGVAAVDHLVVLAVLVAVTELLVPEPLAESSILSGQLGGGLALGLAMATKYVAAVPVLSVLGALLLVRPVRWRRVLTASGVAALAGSFWYVRNLWTTGNPFYPLFWTLFGGRGWSARDDLRFNALVHEGVRGARSWLEGLGLLFHDGPGLGLWLFLALVLAVAGAVRGPERRGTRRVAVAALLMLVGWLLTSHTTRYALPMAALAAVLAAAGLATLEKGVRRLGQVAVGVTLVSGLLFFGGFVLGTLHMDALWLGRVPADTWRHRVTVNDPLPGYRAADELLPPGERLFIVGEGRPWGCRRPFDISSPYETQHLQLIVEDAHAGEEVARALTGSGWRFLLINWGEIDRLGPAYGNLRFSSASDERVWRQFLEHFTRRIWVSGPVEIREILSAKPSGGGEDAPAGPGP